MTREEIAKAINEDKIVKYDGAKYQVVGYKVLKNQRGVKNYYIILLDLKNMRTYIQVGIDDV